MDHLRRFLPAFLFGFVVLVCTHAAFFIADKLGWHPDQQLGEFILGAPSMVSADWVRWTIAVVLSLCAWGAAHHFFYRRQQASDLPQSPNLADGLNVSDMRFTHQLIRSERHMEISMRVFNGTGRTVNFHSLSGQIKFSAPNSNDPSQMGILPPPTLRSDVANSVLPLKEWFLVLDQRVPSVEADKIVTLIESKIPVHMAFDGVNILITAAGIDGPERLPLWNGMSYSPEFGFGRIINASAHISLGLNARAG